ncbi:MAG: hypothetical protein AB7O96_16895 [Pseudobdellovibrionaceae bacterium]
MPELALMYAVGLGVNLILAAIHLLLQLRKLHSLDLLKIQENLSKVNLIWSDREGRLRNKAEYNAEVEWKKQKKTIILTGAFCSLLSWPGLGLQFLIMLSIRFLARPRLEKILWSSQLAEMSLDEKTVASFLNERNLQA